MPLCRHHRAGVSWQCQSAGFNAIAYPLLNLVAPLETLLDELFDGKRPPLYYDVAQWTRASRRFRTFVETYRVKIRSKISRIRNTDEMADLRAELQTAAILLQEPHFVVEYEKHAARKERGADLTILWKTHTPANIEVRRVRSADLDLADADARLVKLIHILADKIGQTAPSVINLLWIVTEEPISQEDIARAMQWLRSTAEQKADAFFVRRGYRGAADFLKRYQQLTAIAVRLPAESILWQNPIARHKLPAPLVAAFQRLQNP